MSEGGIGNNTNNDTETRIDDTKLDSAATSDRSNRQTSDTAAKRPTSAQIAASRSGKIRNPSKTRQTTQDNES